MKILYKIILLICLLMSPVMAASVFDSPSNAKYVMANIPQFRNISCSFSQSKTISGSSTVLKSGGDFSFYKTKGIVFYTKYPVKMTTTYSFGQNVKVNKIINEVINKNYTFLDKNFNLFFKKSNMWELGLVPKNIEMKKYINNIYISGDVNIRVIEIKNIDGSITKINFKVY